MSSFYSLRFSWQQTPSAWRQAQQWNERQRSFNSDFFDASANVANSFATAGINQGTGVGTLAAQAALARIQNEAKAKVAKNAAEAEKAAAAAPPEKPSIVYLSDGTKIDLATNTMMSPNGTSWNVVTGLQKLDVTA